MIGATSSVRPASSLPAPRRGPMRQRRMNRASSMIVFGLVAAWAHGVCAQTPELREFREIYQELVETNTTDSVGDTTRAAEAMAARLRAAGFPAGDVQMLAPHPRKGNLVARYRGDGSGRPLL